MKMPMSARAEASSWRRLRDATLTAELRDTLAHDPRAAGLELDVTVRGGVAHVAGEVDSEDRRSLLRALLRRQAGLSAVWDRLTLPGQRLDVLDIGCGDTKQVPGAIGLDGEAGPGVDCVADLERRLPFADDRFDNIFAVHVLEHIRDLLGLMRELHRILRPTGVLHVLAPHWREINAVADPTHCRYIDVQTFKHFCQARPGVLPWRPLAAASADGDVFADMQPIKDGPPASRDALARWFT